MRARLEPPHTRLLTSCCARSDEPYVESVHFGKYACPGDTSNFSPLLTNESLASVNYEVDPDLSRFCAIADQEQAWTVRAARSLERPAGDPTTRAQVYNSRELCGTVKLSGEPQLGLHFEPKCLYAVIASNSRRDLFNEMMVSLALPRGGSAATETAPLARRLPDVCSRTPST